MHPQLLRILVALFCILATGASSCKKYLSANSQNKSYIESAADLDELLVAESYYNYETATPQMLYLLDDDVELRGKANVSESVLPTGFHYWQSEPRMGSDGKVNNADPFFTDLYKRISRINTILFNLSALKDKGEPASTLSRIAGEAYFLRAFYYFTLVNLYGKPYKPSTATNDFGVPVKTDPAIKDQFIGRSTTQQVYDLIIADLLKAETDLAGVNQASTIRANQLAAQALLSRVYLFIEDNEKALLYANKVISSNTHQLKDLNNYIAGEDFLTRSSPEVLFTMGTSWVTNAMIIGFPVVSDDLYMSYSQQDLRREVFFRQVSTGFFGMAKKRKNPNMTIDDVSDIFLVRLSEQYLNKAEALTALDRFEEARTTLQELRTKRFKPADLSPVTEEGAALMNLIRQERRLELCFENHRWFDLRRYGVNSKYPFSKTIRHRSIDFTGNGYAENGWYELAPYEQDAAAYIMPVANDEIEFNRGLLINEPRPNRPLKQ